MNDNKDRPTNILVDEVDKGTQVSETSDLSEMVSVIAHQLRSPLATIRLTHQTLLENDEKNLSKEQLYILTQAEKRAAHMYDLTTQLLALNTPQEHEKSLVKDLGSVEQLLTELISELSVVIDAKEIKVLMDYHPSPRLIAFDASVLSEGIINILDNAVQYNTQGGSLMVQTLYSDRGVTITIADTGVGIPLTAREKLFTKFLRFESEGNHPNGLGLGLYIAQKALSKHGGTVTYEPNIPKGTKFTLFIPA